MSPIPTFDAAATAFLLGAAVAVFLYAKTVAALATLEGISGRVCVTVQTQVAG